ncbi:four-carbon acid sugar kinase family protein [Salisediminibacterium beveridgei]|uniref:Hydroxyacid dehydrogenase n=1 Tax=Salisediminibacterium beveridgei TaxID=632773 RepID=A0A1D7QX06_9BACI|nr:four-carbon acid sugar kinase family protein [Salisediminibacterium beveridgei]AOM83542.1 hypothetical protein BBEV_2184 [Salisediminibacterium beveridgei]
MAENTHLLYSDFISEYRNNEIYDLLDDKVDQYIDKMDYKVIVLDDDPTGTQTVHSIPVYTEYDDKAINHVFMEESKTVYILTNSRAMTESQTEILHLKIGQTIEKIARIHEKKYLIISRGDSTLRGHYPLELESLYKARPVYEGEILIPAFFEGNRYTCNDVHYIKKGEYLVPVNETEFADDKTFGFENAHLPSYIKEKSERKIDDQDIISISIEELRMKKIAEIKKKLTSNSSYKRIIVNALNENDLKIFLIAFFELDSHNYLFRTAASFVKIISGVKARSFMEPPLSNRKGLMLVGSHVDMTTKQLHYLMNHEKNLSTIELNVNSLKSKESIKEELNNIVDFYEGSNDDVCIYTSREYVKPDNTELSELEFSVGVSEALVEIVKNISTPPRFILSKGGITSSDIAVKSLNIYRALVLGQIEKGISVWKPDSDSKFPDTPYIIFPGNVGEEETLFNVYQKIKR